MATHPTARLWVQYMEMISLLRQFIKAERTGKWTLHLQTLHQMLPYFAAAGHNSYTKSVHIYLQQMIQVHAKHPDVYVFFNTGHHVIRRSDRFWAGLSADLVIEQVLMRSMKTTGGLTRGRGMAESQRTQWLLSMPACADVNGAMQDLTEANYVTSDQHKDSTMTRKTRDNRDNLALLGFLQDRNPFTHKSSPRNIATGVAADVSVNVHNALEVGNNIIKSMEGKNALDYVFKKKSQVVTMGHKISAKVDGESIQVDPQLLFQRLLTVAAKVTENVQEIFKYELCSNLSSLFEPSGLLRQANKPILADAVWALGRGNEMPAPDEEDMSYVLDGGSLIQRLPWKRDETFDSICKSYVDYVIRKYTSPIIVFDGYDTGPSTKDTTHLRRTKGAVGAQVNFVGGMPLKTKKEHFLANSMNKQKFILLLIERLAVNGLATVHADGDADLLIAQTAVNSAAKKATTVIGEDTDLLVLLCFHADPHSHGLFLRSEGGKNTKSLRIWNINWLQITLGPEVCHLLPFVHAMTGCDTTSRLFGMGKGIALRKLNSDPQFRGNAEVFSNEASKKDIICAGEKTLTCLYGGRSDEDLDALRYRRFCERVSSSNTSVSVHSPPPTHKQLPAIIALVYITKFNSGWENQITWIQKSGDGF
ncbi:hypothetical protein SNE40_016353 [Patella caerulea]|uniref:Uncharacterized protein n=1 Tax=Patella caerulea TaxID=87958 RepID=A0AAN8J8H5_PATCE